ncbi:MAG: hypothetical protein ABJE95_04800 [Byssovorax sp.]
MPSRTSRAIWSFLALLTLFFGFPRAALAYDCEGHPECCKPVCDDLCCYQLTNATCFDDSCSSASCTDTCGYCDLACLDAANMPTGPTDVCTTNADCKAPGESCQDYDCDGIRHCAKSNEGGTGNCCLGADSCVDGYGCCPPQAPGSKAQCRPTGDCGKAECGLPTIPMSKVHDALAAYGSVVDLPDGRPRGHLVTSFAPSANWSMDVELSANDGISFQNVTLGSRIMAAEMNVPYLSLRTSPTASNALPNFPARCELKPTGVACSTEINPQMGMGQSRLVGFGVAGTPQLFRVIAHYEIDPASYNPPGSPYPTECFHAEQDFTFTDFDPTGCEPSAGLPCNRYYPEVRYTYVNEKASPRIFVRVPQRFVYTPDGHGNGGTAFFGDLPLILAGGAVFEPSNPWGNKISIVWPLDKNPLDKETRQFVILKNTPVQVPITRAAWVLNYIEKRYELEGVTLGSIDNYHQSCKPGFVDEPGIRTVLVSPTTKLPPFIPVPMPRPGCPDCIHMHWHWSPIADVLAAFEGKGGSFGWGKLLTYDDDNQSVVITHAILKAGEEDPVDYRSTVAPLETFGPSDNAVFWYETLSTSYHSETWKHGGFFSAGGGACSKGAKCDSPPGDTRTATASPATSAPERGTSPWVLAFSAVLLGATARLGFRRGTKSAIGSAACLLLLVLPAVLPSCGGGDTGTSAATSGSGGGATGSGTTTGDPPPMPGLNPSYAFRGRTSEIVVLKPGASFGASPTVTVGDGTIKVKSVTSVAADTVKIRLNVPVDAAETTAAVTVGGVAIGDLDLAEALSIPSIRLPVTQGGVSRLEIANVDAAHPLDDQLRIESITGVLVSLDHVDAGFLASDLWLAPDATLGKAMVKVILAPDASGDPVEARLTDAFEVTANPWKDLPLGAPTSFTLKAGDPYLSLRLTGLESKVLDLEVQPDKASGGPAVVRTLLSIHDPKDGLNHLLTRLVPGPTLTDEIALAGDILARVTLIDGPSTTDTTFTITARALSPAVVTETKPDNLSINAMPVKLPILVDASLADAGDRALFSIQAGVGNLVVRTLPPSDPAAQAADTHAEILTSALARVANNDDEYAGSTFSLIDSAVPTGQIYVRVRRGDNAFVTSGKYRLLIFQR